MIQNESPTKGKFNYDFGRVPFCFSKPNKTMIKDYHSQTNSIVRAFFKNLRGEISHNQPFCNYPITAGEFSIMFIKKNHQKRS